MSHFRYQIVGFLALITALVGLFAAPAFASGVILSITPPDNASNGIYTGGVMLTVYGPSNSSVLLYYYPANQQYPYTNSPTFVANLGTTQSNGYFSVNLSNNSYNIPTGDQVYVVAGGDQSNAVSWPNASSYPSTYPSTYPYNNNTYTYPPTVYPTYPVAPVVPTVPSETGSVSVGVGQSLTIYPQNGGSYSITSDSNSAVVSATSGGSGVTLYGNEVGSAVVSICPLYYAYNSSPCAAVTVIVTPNISFSQSNVTLYGTGSSQTITLNGAYGSNYNTYGNTSSCGVYPYNNGSYNNYYNYSGQYNCGQYYIASNSNPGVVSASVSGNSLYVSGVGYGGSTITICQAAGSPCGTVYVSVNGATNNYYSNYYPYQYQQPNTYVYTQPAPVYNYYRPTYVMPGWMRR
jgi:hypothetical protein